MSKKKKNKQPREPYPWLTQFAQFGIDDIGTAYDVLWENDLPDETIENGYPDWALNRIGSQKEAEANASPETLNISEYQGKYIAWTCGCSVGNFNDDFTEESDFAVVCDTLEDARKVNDNKPSGGRPYIEQILACKEELGDSKYWISCTSCSFGGCNFSVYYDRNLIVENLPSLDLELMRQSAEALKALDETLEDMGVTLGRIEKLPREWNQNIRYYGYSICYLWEWHDLTAQILSKTQHKMRFPVDMFPMNEVKTMVDEAVSSGKAQQYEEDRAAEWEEYQCRYNAALQGISVGEDIQPIPLSSAQRVSLRKNLEPIAANLGLCDCTLKRTTEWVVANIEPDKRAGVIKGIQDGGGFCDCEVIMNYFGDSEWY